MVEKVGRNEPCPCGSGKKYKQCCWNKRLPLSKRKFKATVISSGSQAQNNQPPNLMERTFGNAIRSATESDKPPLAPTPPPSEQTETEKEE
jgi:uncharacterized protein